MAPSMCRVVVYHNAEGGECPAIIQAVNPDGTIELIAFSLNGIVFAHNVEEGTESGQWSWPVIVP